MTQQTTDQKGESWEERLKQQEPSLFWKDAEHCTCYPPDTEMGQTKVLPDRLVDFIRQERQQAYDEGRGSLIQDSNGFIRETMMPEEAIKLAKREAIREFVSQVLYHNQAYINLSDLHRFADEYLELENHDDERNN